MPIQQLIEQRRARWLSTRSLALGGGVLALTVVGAFAAFAAYERQEHLAAEARRVALLAHIIEDQADAQADAATVVLDSVADEVGRDIADGRLDRPGDLRPAQGFGKTGIVQVALLDEQGQPVSGSDALPAGAVQVSRAVAGPDGRRFQLVASLDTATFTRHMERLLAGDADAAVLARTGGEVLAATQSSGLRAGQAHAGLAALLARPAEAGAHETDGLRPGTQIVAVRALPSRPLFVVVEHARARALAQWSEEMRRVGIVAAVGVAFVLLTTLLALRIQRSREAVRNDLDAALVELALRGSELGVLVASVQELIFRTDANGRLSFLNARWQAATGQDTDSLLGRPLASLVSDECQARAAALFDAGDSQPLRRARLILRAPSGTERHLNVAVVPLHTTGQLTGFAGSAVDVTEQVLAEHRLKEQLAYNQLLVEVSPLPTSLVDAQGRFLAVNHAWEQLRGRSKASVIGRPVSDFVPADDHERLHAQNEALLREGGQLRYETTIVAGDGSTRDVVLSKVAVVDAAHGPAVLTVAMDVSEFREAERATRQARDLAEQASRSKSEFVANISHELRTPLQSILGYSELGIARSAAQPRLNGMFTDVHEAGQRMLALVNDLLDVSKLESSVGSFRIERGDLRDWVRSVSRELEPLLAKRQQRVELALGAAPLMTRADPLRLQQVVRNVLANAIKFSPEGSAIDLSAGPAGDGGIELRIRDHGPGIPGAELERIFEAFVQSSQPRAGAGGTGLGLAISRKIVQAHGGRIWAENADGGGSRFHIVLPAADGLGESTQAP